MQIRTHHLPGRLRIRTELLRDNQPLADETRERLLESAGISEIRHNPLTGSLLVHFDERLVRAEQISQKVLEVLHEASGVSLQECAGGGPKRLLTGATISLAADSGRLWAVKLPAPIASAGRSVCKKVTRKAVAYGLERAGLSFLAFFL